MTNVDDVRGQLYIRKMTVQNQLENLCRMCMVKQKYYYSINDLRIRMNDVFFLLFLAMYRLPILIHNKSCHFWKKERIFILSHSQEIKKT